MTDAQGQSTNYTYFVDNNLQQVSYTNAIHTTPSVSYVYDTNYNRLITMTDGTGLTTYGYNPIAVPPSLGAGRLASIDGPLANDAITYSYDELGRVTNRSINGAANAASVQYDSLGRVQNVTNPLGTFNYGYVNTTGRADHVDYPNGQKTQYAYFDNLGDQRLKQIKNIDPSNAVISQFDYTYNPASQITTWTQANSGMTNPRRYNFGYDAADQLRSANLIDTVTGAGVNQYNYDYDPAGNRTNTQIGSAITTSVANNLNQITSQSSGGKMHFRGTVNESATVTVGGNAASVDGAGNFDGTANVNVGPNTVAIVATDASGNSRTNDYQVNVPSGVNTTFLYDLNGNLTNDGTKTFEWDTANRCTAINQGTHRTEVTYDGQGRETKRVEKENGAVTETKQFIWDGWRRSEERDANTQARKRFYTQGEQITGSIYFVSHDHLGSIRELADSSGVIHARYDYDAFGIRAKLSGDLNADFGFTAHYMTSQDTDLAFALFRVYSTNAGRWINRDPINESGGLNLYGYVGNDPIKRIDPLGLWYWLAPWTWFDGNGMQGLGNQFYRGADWDQGAYAGLDGLFPFWDPFADNDFYDPCDSTAGISQRLGQVSQTALSMAAGSLVLSRFSSVLANNEWLGKGSYLFGRGGQFGQNGIFNQGSIRTGWGWSGTRAVGRDVFRTSWSTAGIRTYWNHLDWF
jgi:RHS repeat-associated protein